MAHRLAAVLVLALMACDEAPTIPTREQIGGRWVVSSLQPANADEVVPSAGVVLAVEFTEDRIAVQSDCNGCSGRFALTGDKITFSSLACTLRSCRQDSLEGPFLDVLSNATSIGMLSPSGLILEGPRGRIVFRR